MQTTNIRRASTADLDALVPLFDAYRMFYAQPSDPVRARDFLAERFANAESVVLLAERGASAVGFTQLYPIFSSVRTARTWLLNDLFVIDGARRHGVARALLEAASGSARAHGAAGLMLETTRDNPPPRPLSPAPPGHQHQPPPTSP